MRNIAKTRRQVIIQRTLELYQNLKSIRQNIEIGNNVFKNKKQMREHSQQKTMALGNKIRGLVDKESKFQKPPSAGTLKREKMAKLGLKQGFEKVQQKADGT